MKKILSFLCVFVTVNTFAQVQNFQKIKFNGNVSNVKVANLMFQGKVFTPTKTVLKPISDRKTVRDGVTKEVLPYDGSNNGATETEGNVNTTTQNNTICQSQNVTLSAGFNELTLLDPNGIEIWPGRIIKISSIDDGSYTSFTDYTKRKDLNIALIASGTSARTVVATIPAASGITQGKVIDARDRIKNQFGSNDFGSNQWMFDYYNYYNTNQLLIEAGAGVNITPANFELRANAGFNTAVKKNKIIIKFARQAFDVKVDNDLSNLVEATNLSDDAGVIANVTYGSLGIIEIESDSSLTDMNAALDFSFNVDPSVAISGNLRTQLNNTIASMSIKGIFKGVSGNSEIVPFPSINDLKNMLIGSGPITATTPVVPLSFIVKSLKDGSTMMLKSTMSYNKRECTVIPPNGETKLKIKLLALTVPSVNDGLSSDEDIFGNIKMKVNLEGQNSFTTKWSKSRANNVKVQSSTLPTSPGAYSLVGDASNFSFTIKNDVSLINRTKLSVKVDLMDDELWDVFYQDRTFEFPVADLIKSIGASPTDSIENFDSTNAKAFYMDVVEVGNTNKVRVWFKVQKEN